MSTLERTRGLIQSRLTVLSREQSQTPMAREMEELKAELKLLDDKIIRPLPRETRKRQRRHAQTIRGVRLVPQDEVAKAAYAVIRRHGAQSLHQLVRRLSHTHRQYFEAGSSPEQIYQVISNAIRTRAKARRVRLKLDKAQGCWQTY